MIGWLYLGWDYENETLNQDKMKLEKLNFDLLEIHSLNIADVIPRFISEKRKKEEKIFTSALRIMAEPPIKGEITKGKLTWRGIRLIRQQVGFDSYSWLEQRGKQISPKIVFTVGNGL